MKSGYRTSEFWVAVAVSFIGFLATTGLFTPEQSDALQKAATQLGGIAAMVVSGFGYSISRGHAKRGDK